MASNKFNSLEKPFPIQTGNHACQVHHEEGYKIAKGLYAQIIFIILGPYIIFFHTEPDAIATFSIIFSSIVLEAFPFMLIGALIGGLIEVFVSREALINLLRNWASYSERQVSIQGLLHQSLKDNAAYLFF